MHRLGGGGAGRVYVYRRAPGAHPLGELTVRYRYHFQQEVLAESIRVSVRAGPVIREVTLQPRTQSGFIALGRQLVYYPVVNLPQLFGGAARVFIIEIMRYFLK